MAIYSRFLLSGPNRLSQVQRVKNKWKCVLKDGMIHVNGKDYLFMKCNGIAQHSETLSWFSYDRYVKRVLYYRQHHSPMRVWFTRDISSDGYFCREIGVAI
ncbi:TFIIA domain-containing protein [Rhizoctonia solani AG-1 IA]|uniref:TFIIA domain-containing protein n=1 Tax=Thanatephorus cucumeris (strain AG1-IA) TaxID=983506 RepID=L8WC81_THACA|nr:TFIIA domain-containing protein [Rhizoctonia solani AG-1 IA]